MSLHFFREWRRTNKKLQNKFKQSSCLSLPLFVVEAKVHLMLTFCSSIRKTPSLLMLSQNSINSKKIRTLKSHRKMDVQWLMF
jgi:hypothetical protein